MELDDVGEHLETLIAKMKDPGSIEESTFAIDLGHTYAHFNRIWHSKLTEKQWEEFSKFPTDLRPVG
jgi:hypothetical protein